METLENVFNDLRSADLESLSAKDKVLKTAIILFNRDGVLATGVDRIIAEAGVAKMTFYKHFPSKADLVSAYLDFKDRARSENLLKHTVHKTTEPKEQLLGVFDSLEDWFREPDFKGCPFVRGLYEFSSERDESVHKKVTSHFSGITAFVEDRLKQIVPEKDLPRCRDQILSLIVGSVIVALATSNALIAQTNKLLVGELLREATSRSDT